MVKTQDIEWVDVDPDLATIVPGYLENKRKEVSDLENALARSDYEFIQRYGHRLKGSGGGYGFPKLTELGAALEIQCTSKKFDELSEIVSELRAYLERVRLKETS